MEMLIVETAVMKIRQSVITALAIRKPNLVAKTVNVSRCCGCAISITIAETIPMSRHICVDNGIVRTAGNGVRVRKIIVAYRIGCFAMVKMTVEMVVTNWPKIVFLAIQISNLNVIIIDVFRVNGCATIQTIVEMVPTRRILCVKIITDPVQSRSSVAITVNVFRIDGDAITRTIAMTKVTKWVVNGFNAATGHFNALPVIVSHLISDVMAIEIVEIYRMK